jgi:hypothetical protein
MTRRRRLRAPIAHHRLGRLLQELVGEPFRLLEFLHEL